jgi:hypothetical protein
VVGHSLLQESEGSPDILERFGEEADEDEEEAEGYEV